MEQTLSTISFQLWAIIFMLGVITGILMAKK